MPLQKIFYTKGLDSDTSPELLQEGMGRYRENVRVMSSNDGEGQSAETVLGNTLVPNSALPTGINTVIGSFEYQLTKKNYYFVHNSLSNHAIFEYDQVTNVVNLVFRDPILNFKLEALITGVDIIALDKDNHLLYWTDGWINPNDENDFNEPKKINIEKGKFFMAGDYVNGYKFPFDPEILYRVKKPPLKAPTYIWSGLSTQQNFEFQAAGNGVGISLDANDAGVSGLTPTTQPQLIKFVNAFNNAAPKQYNPANSIWTVKTTGTYNVEAQINSWLYGYDLTNTLFGLGNTVHYTTTLRGYILVNGSIRSNGYSSATHFGAVSVNMADVLLLNAGDQVTIMASLLGTGSSQGTTYGSSFSAIKVVSNETTINSLFKKLFKFKQQFVFDDYEISAWSPISNYVMPSTMPSLPTQEDISFQDNKITIKVFTGSSIVTKIRIAALEIGNYVAPALSSIDFSLIAILDKAELGILDNTYYDYVFTNEVNGVPLEVNESIKLFDNVPLTAQTSTLIKGMRLVDGNITENFDAVPIDMRLPITYGSIETNASNTSFPARQYLKTGTKRLLGIVYFDHANRSGKDNIVRGDSKIILSNGTYGTTLYIPFLTEDSYGVNPDGTKSPVSMSLVPLVNAEIYNPPPVSATHYQLISSKMQNMGRWIQFVAQTVTYNDLAGLPTSSSAAVQIAVSVANITGVYKSENGNSALVYDWVPGDRIRFIVVPSPVGKTDTGGGNWEYPNAYPFTAFNDTEISGFDAPNLTVSFLINNNNSFRVFEGGILFEIYNPTVEVIDDGELVYEIGECFDIITLPNGDRVHQGQVGYPGQGGDQAYFPFYNDLYVGGFVAFLVTGISGFVIGDKIKATSLVHNNNNTYGTITNISISGTTQTITTDIPFNQSSVTNAGILTKAAIITFKGGDCFRRLCNMPWKPSPSVTYRFYSYIETMSVSNMFTSNAYWYGRPNAVDPNIKRIQRPATICYSNLFVPETFINGLSSTSDNNFESYEIPNGGIYQLESDDQQLKMYQQLKIGSIPIEQSITSTTTGFDVIGTSEKVLSPTARYRTADYGIGNHPESFARYANSEYGIDVKRRTVWRDGQNGLIPISDYFMSIFWGNLCEQILASPTKVNIYGTFDVYFGEYIIAVEAFSYTENGVLINVPAQTLAFNERNNMWSTFYSYSPENMVSNGVNVITFKEGQLWKHNDNNVYNNFYGVQYTSKLWAYCNIEPSKIKVYEALSLECKDTWDAIVETPVTLENPLGQHTEMIDANYTRKEGFQYTPILKDDFTPNTVVGAPFLPNARFTGKVMRGQYAHIKLEYKGITYTKIFASNALVISSERSNK